MHNDNSIVNVSSHLILKIFSLLFEASYTSCFVLSISVSSYSLSWRIFLVHEKLKAQSLMKSRSMGSGFYLKIRSQKHAKMFHLFS